MPHSLCRDARSSAVWTCPAGGPGQGERSGCFKEATEGERCKVKEAEGPPCPEALNSPMDVIFIDLREQCNFFCIGTEPNNRALEPKMPLAS